MQLKMQFLLKSWNNVIVCCVDRPCICIVFILYYCTSQSTCVNKLRVRFTILFHLKTMTATTFKTYQVWECVQGLPPSFDHNMTDTELTKRFGWESVRLIPSRLGQWARSQGINPGSHTKQIDNSGSATTVLATKYLYNDAKCLFLFESWVLFLKCRPSSLFWSRDTNRPISIKKMWLLPCQPVVVPAKTFFRDYCQHHVLCWF